MESSGEARRSGAQTRAAVLDAAERLFAAHGYRGTSLEEIGRDAGLSRGTPGYLFGSKERLYAEVVTRILDRAQSTLAPIAARMADGDTPVAELVAEFVAAHVGLLASEPSLVRLIQREALDGNGRILSEIGTQAQTFVALIQNLTGRDGQQGISEDAATQLLIGAAALCWFPLAHANLLQGAFGRDPHEPDAIAAQAQTTVAFVLMRLAALRSTPVA